MESEFRAKNPTPAPGYYQMLIDKLRQTREENPLVDLAAGSLPIVGGVEAAADISDKTLSPVERGLSAASFIPGGKLLARLLPEQLRKGKLTGALGMADVTDMKGWRAKQKKTAEILRKQQNQSVGAEAKLENILSNVDKIDTSGPQRKLPADVFYRSDKDHGDFLMGADDWERKNLRWNDKGEILHPKDGWVGPDHPDYLEPLDAYRQKIEAHQMGEQTYVPEDIFQKPDLKMTAEQRAANLKSKNDEAKRIAEQWLKDNPK